jgi:hypothetical protein
MELFGKPIAFGPVAGSEGNWTLREVPEGMKRHPPNGTYDDGCEVHVCTCKPECPYPCKGECGCHACAQRYSEWLGDSFRDG